jgi:hypothetical protein
LGYQKREARMPKYRIEVFCSDCSQHHQMNATIHINDGPAERQSLEDFYDGKRPPPGIAKVAQGRAQCLNTGKLFNQKDYRKIFLVPAADEE